MVTLTNMPAGIAALSKDDRGYPVPWFASWLVRAKAPNFQVVDPMKLETAIRFQVCWCCGQSLKGGTGVFVVGPMCGITHVSSEPPSCDACAVWSVQNCPFLKNPNMKRMPQGNHRDAPGLMIKRNPGVTLLWETTAYRPFEVDGGILIRMGEPESVRFFKEGRQATRAEIVHSVEGGLSNLRNAALQQGPQAISELMQAQREFETLLPKE